MKKTRNNEPLGVGPLGGFDFEWTEEDTAAGHGAIALTGSCSGTVFLKDGSSYDLTENVIPCKAEHAGPLTHVIHTRLVAIGAIDAPHLCSDECGFEKIEAAAPVTE